MSLLRATVVQWLQSCWDEGLTIRSHMKHHHHNLIEPLPRGVSPPRSVGPAGRLAACLQRSSRPAPSAPIAPASRPPARASAAPPLPSAAALSPDPRSPPTGLLTVGALRRGRQSLRGALRDPGEAALRAVLSLGVGAPSCLPSGRNTHHALCAAARGLYPGLTELGSESPSPGTRLDRPPARPFLAARPPRPPGSGSDTFALPLYGRAWASWLAAGEASRPAASAPIPGNKCWTAHQAQIAVEPSPQQAGQAAEPPRVPPGGGSPGSAAGRGATAGRAGEAPRARKPSAAPRLRAASASGGALRRSRGDRRKAVCSCRVRCGDRGPPERAI